MDCRINNFTLLLLLATVLVLSAALNESGSSRRSKNTESAAKLSDNIGENPFLRDYVVTSYQGNPFLSSTAKPQFGNGSAPTSIGSETPHEEQTVNIGVYAHNPFLQSGGNVAYRPFNRANLTATHIHDRNTPYVVNQPPVSGNAPIIQDDSINTRTKSDIKCEEYSKRITDTAEVLPLVGRRTEVTKVTVEECWPVNELVVGGTAAGPNEYPHMVALGKRTPTGDFTLLCGGTLISPDWVLTAAHCTFGPFGSPNTARIGINDLKDHQAGVSVAINRIVRHPNYKPPAMYADIALMKLQTSVTFGSSIRPACLYQIYDMIPFQTWVTGWGVTEFGGDQTDKLQKARLDIVDNIACAIKYNQSIAVPYGITPSMICAGDPQGGWAKDTCQGDSGGPMQTRHPKYPCVYQVIGITSFGQACAIVDTPGVYTRVSHYLTWIEDTVWPDPESFDNEAIVLPSDDIN